jgi:hypothetical protein
MARLPKGAETTISMAFLVMCAEKILRLLRLFFVAILAWFCAWDCHGSLWGALTNFCCLGQPNRESVHIQVFELATSLALGWS